MDIVTAWIDTANGISKPNSGSRCLKSQFHYVSGHAVGSIYRTKLHEKLGYYSRKFPIAAEQLFMVTIAKSGAKIKIVEKIVGKFSDEGLSGTDILGSLSEVFRINLILGENKLLQTILFILRLIKNFRRI